MKIPKTKEEREQYFKLREEHRSRIQILQIPAAQIVEMFNAAPREYDMLAVPILPGLPEGYEVLSVNGNWSTGTIDFRLWHIDFAEVPAGEIPPIVPPPLSQAISMCVMYRHLEMYDVCGDIKTIAEKYIEVEQDDGTMTQLETFDIVIGGRHMQGFTSREEADRCANIYRQDLVSLIHSDRKQQTPRWMHPQVKPTVTAESRKFFITAWQISWRVRYSISMYNFQGWCHQTNVGKKHDKFLGWREDAIEWPGSAHVPSERQEELQPTGESR